jgi:tRNA pseudouridine38-40 synthase
VKRYRLQVEYDGSEFRGWQWQPNGRTVQGVIEEALQRIFRQEIRVNGSGRTDSGVHALGQTAHFEAPECFPPEKLLLALNGNLPEDVRVWELREADPDFHARFSAHWRWYRYRIFTRQRAVERQFGWYLKFRLDTQRLQEAARLLVGEHDFTAFSCLGQDEPATPHGCKCLVYAAGWELSAEEFRFHIVANRFLRHMVRGLVGAIVDVSRGRFDLDYFAALLKETKKPDLVKNAQARGLCLMRVGYGEFPYIEPDSNETLNLPFQL